MSSAKNKCVNISPFLHKKKPLIFPGLAACLMRPCNPSMQSEKRKGNNGSPCLIPLGPSRVNQAFGLSINKNRVGNSLHTNLN